MSLLLSNMLHCQKRTTFEKIHTYLALGLDIYDIRILTVIKSVYEYYEFALELYKKVTMGKISMRNIPFDLLRLDEAAEMCVFEVKLDPQLSSSVPSKVLTTKIYMDEAAQNPLLLPPGYLFIIGLALIIKAFSGIVNKNKK